MPESQGLAFAQQIIAAAERGYPAVDNNVDYTNIISERHRSRLSAALAEARDRNSTILRHTDAHSGNGKIAPTVIIDPHPDSLLMREEIFGPILPVI